MIGVIGVAAMVASVIGHGISDYPSHDRADRAADNSPGDRAPTRPVSSAKAIWDDAQSNTAAERTRLILDIETSCEGRKPAAALRQLVTNRSER